jgi:arylformamidase
MSYIDVSVPLHGQMVGWPGDPAISIDRALSMDRGDRCNVTRLTMSAHTGTHMDAPRHFVRVGHAMETLPIDAVIGPARVVEIRDPVMIGLDELKALGPRRGERILFKTRNSPRCWETDAFYEDFVYISAAAARHLAEAGVRTVGVDYLSVGGYRNDAVETHEALLVAGIWIIEGLNLTNVAPGNYDLICLPLKIVGSDGAPARAVLRAAT